MSLPVHFTLITLGCKVNQYESHALREAWQAAGWRELPFGEKQAVLHSGQHLVAVNSCAVTAKAVADVRAAVSRAHRQWPHALIVITGCAAEVCAAELASLPGVAGVIPQSRKDGLRELPGSLLWQELCSHGSGHALPDVFFAADQAAGHMFPAFHVSGYDRSRAVLKVHEGCSHRCTYCIVPLTRGPGRSRPPIECVEELRRLLQAGFREITVNGINLAQYGRDFAVPCDFWDLLAFMERELADEWAGEARFRLSSLEPGQLGEKALETLAGSRLTAPHIHLSLQSGSPEVLRRMGRGHYSPSGLPDFFSRLQTIWPLFGLGADILTAFPGESEEQTRETEELCRLLPFSYAHVFPYSRRPGTPAATWPGQLGNAVKKERAARLRMIFEEKKQAFLERQLGLERVNVVYESPGKSGKGGMRGVNEYYCECELRGTPPKGDLGGALVPGIPLAVEHGILLVGAV